MSFVAVHVGVLERWLRCRVRIYLVAHHSSFTDNVPWTAADIRGRWSWWVLLLLVKIVLHLWFWFRVVEDQALNGSRPWHRRLAFCLVERLEPKSHVHIEGLRCMPPWATAFLILHLAGRFGTSRWVWVDWTHTRPKQYGGSRPCQWMPCTSLDIQTRQQWLWLTVNK